MQMVGVQRPSSAARKLIGKLQRMGSSRRSRDSRSSGSLGSDWLQRTSSSSWEFFSDEYSQGSDGEEEEDVNLPKDVPQGCLAVYVGDEQERKRFVVDARHLNHRWFKILLERSADEYGFDHKAGLTLPCRVVVFEDLLRLLEQGGEPSPKQQAQIEKLLRL